MHYDILAATILFALLAGTARASQFDEAPRNTTAPATPVQPLVRPAAYLAPDLAYSSLPSSSRDVGLAVSRLPTADISATPRTSTLNQIEARCDQMIRRLRSSGVSAAFDPVISRVLQEGAGAPQEVGIDVAAGTTYWIVADIQDWDPTGLNVADLNVELIDEQGKVLASDLRRNRSVVVSFQSSYSGRVIAKFTTAKALGEEVAFMVAVGRAGDSGGTVVLRRESTSSLVAPTSEEYAVSTARKNSRKAAERYGRFQPVELTAGLIEGGSSQDFKLPVKKGLSYRAIVDGDEMSLNIDLQVLDANGQVIAKDMSSNRSARVAFFPKVEGEVVLRVVMARSRGAGAFALFAGEAAGPGSPRLGDGATAPEATRDENEALDTEASASGPSDRTGDASSAPRGDSVPSSTIELKSAADRVETLARAQSGFEYEERQTKRLLPAETGIVTSLTVEPGRTYIILAECGGEEVINLDLRLTSADNALIGEDKRPNREAVVRFEASKQEVVSVRLELSGSDRKSEAEIALKVGSAPTVDSVGQKSSPALEVKPTP